MLAHKTFNLTHWWEWIFIAKKETWNSEFNGICLWIFLMIIFYFSISFISSFLKHIPEWQNSWLKRAMSRINRPCTFWINYFSHTCLSTCLQGFSKNRINLWSWILVWLWRLENSLPDTSFLTLFTMSTCSVLKRGVFYQFGHAKNRRLCSFLPMKSKQL